MNSIFDLRFAVVACLLLSGIQAARAEVAKYHERDAELSIAQISDRTVKIVLSPIDPKSGKTIAAPQSRVLVEQKPEVKLQLRNVDAEQEVACDNLRVSVAPNPLTVTIIRESGETVQRLTLPADEAGSMTFRAAAPVLGMGEGAQQFDRRGAKYSMKDGWGAWERPTLGSWVAVPFLVGTDGWTLFVHHPQGEFDLREETATFTPWPDQEDIAARGVRHRLGPAGRRPRGVRSPDRPAPLPPKWAMGFMQSHRTLQSPAEVLQVAREFRERRLPCDALIYLGTGLLSGRLEHGPRQPRFQSGRV